MRASVPAMHAALAVIASSVQPSMAWAPDSFSSVIVQDRSTPVDVITADAWMRLGVPKRPAATCMVCGSLVKSISNRLRPSQSTVM